MKCYTLFCRHRVVCTRPTWHLGITNNKGTVITESSHSHPAHSLTHYSQPEGGGNWPLDKRQKAQIGADSPACNNRIQHLEGQVTVQEPTAPTGSATSERHEQSLIRYSIRHWLRHDPDESAYAEEHHEDASATTERCGRLWTGSYHHQQAGVKLFTPNAFIMWAIAPQLTGKSVLSPWILRPTLQKEKDLPSGLDCLYFQ